jgi:hypothetical protein
MKISIDRTYDQQQTPGHAAIMDDEGSVIFQFDTLELPWRLNQQNISCIPEGEYIAERRYSEKYKEHLHIKDVKNRSLILIHWGNYAGSVNPRTGHPDIRGCVLVGDGFKDITGDDVSEILNSKSTFNKIMSIVSEKVNLEICGNGGNYGPSGL